MDKSLPADINAERAMIGSCLMDRDAYLVLASWFDPAYCYLEKHGLIMTAIKACYDQRTPPDIVTVGNYLRQHDQIETIGGAQYLLEVMNCVPTSVHVDYYARIVADAALKRNMIIVGGKIAALGYDEAAPFDQTYAAAKQQLDQLQGKHNRDAFMDAVAVSESFMSRFDKRRSGEEESGIMTGWTDLDKKIKGLKRGNLYIGCGRPGMGKSVFAQNIVDYAAKKDYGVCHFIFEMNHEQLQARRLAAETGLELDYILSDSDKFSDSDYHKIVETNGILSKLPVYLCEDRRLTVEGIRDHLLGLIMTTKIDLVVIDYLQLIAYSNPRHDEYAHVSHVSSSLMRMAGELNLPFLVLAQLSRDSEKRNSHIPTLSDLRGSGQIEQDAAAVFALYREEKYDPNTDKKGIAEVHILKQRNGPTGIVSLAFFGSTMKFANLAPGNIEPGTYQHSAPAPQPKKDRPQQRYPRKQEPSGYRQPEGF